MDLRGHVTFFGALETVESLDFVSIENIRSEAKVSNFDVDQTLRLEN